MDEMDAKIIRALAKNADISTVELSTRVGLSVPAVNKRVARLKASGAIRQTTVLTDAEKMGKPMKAYVLVVLDQFQHVEKLVEYVRRDEDVLECSAVTGEYDYLLKICAHDIRHFEEKLIYLKKHCGVARSHTMLALAEEKDTPAVLPGIES